MGKDYTINFWVCALTNNSTIQMTINDKLFLGRKTFWQRVYPPRSTLRKVSVKISWPDLTGGWWMGEEKSVLKVLRWGTQRLGIQSFQRIPVWLIQKELYVHFWHQRTKILNINLKDAWLESIICRFRLFLIKKILQFRSLFLMLTSPLFSFCSQKAIGDWSADGHSLNPPP